MFQILCARFQAAIRALAPPQVAPYLLLGPITGPFMAGVVFNFRDGRPVLGALYAIALSSWTVALPLLVVHGL